MRPTVAKGGDRLITPWGGLVFVVAQLPPCCSLSGSRAVVPSRSSPTGSAIVEWIRWQRWFPPNP
jgi:hypothetical protein